MTRKNQAFFFLCLLPLLTGLACTLPGMETMLGNQVLPTETPFTSTETACPTDEVIPTLAAEVTPTPIEVPVVTLIPTIIPPTATTEPVTTYQLQMGSPAYLHNVHHPENGTLWMSVGGQVFGADGTPVEYVVVRVVGQVRGEPVELLGMSGSADWYGPGGYEILLSESAFASSGNFSIALYDLQMNPLSEPVYFDTYLDQNRVTVIINFTAADSAE